MNKPAEFRILVGAGGTGGHLFPATAVCEQLANVYESEFAASFVGTPDKIEARVVPALGYDFRTIPISGFKGISLSSLMLPFKIAKSVLVCRSIIRNENIKAVLCTGAYLSLPAGLAASLEKTPLILMESNVSPGKAIKMLASKADLIISSFEDSVDYFKPSVRSKVEYLGNPVRANLSKLPDKSTALESYGFSPYKKTVFVFGGSLGALSVNKAVEAGLSKFAAAGIQVIWQTGKNYKPVADIPENVKVFEFIDDMPTAYAAADLVVSRSGASTISELAITGKPSILIPLPSATNNEQAENAKIFMNIGAGVLINNSTVPKVLVDSIIDLVPKDEILQIMSECALLLAKPDAATNAAKRIIELVKK